MDFGLYLHVPWCRIKCGYCDFFSLPTDDDLRIRAAAEGLLRLLDRCLERARWSEGSIRSVYVGGGTPSLLPADFFARLMERLAPRLQSGAEVTVEMNPETLDLPWLKEVREAGVNRASLGVQSLDPERLRQLDRAHSPGQVRQAVEWVRACGYSALALDLIYQLEGQSQEGVLEDLEGLLSWSPEHLSAYGLTVEPGTRLAAQKAAGRYHPLDADAAAEQFSALAVRLREAGYLHYEISNFAKPGHGARHNSLYWLEEAVLGVGPSAVSSWTDANGKRRRERFPADASLLEGNMSQALSILQSEEIHAESAWLEALYLGLRWQGGLCPADLARRFPKDNCSTLLEKLEQSRFRDLFKKMSHMDRLQQAEELFGKDAGPVWKTGDDEALRLKHEAWPLLDEILTRIA